MAKQIANVDTGTYTFQNWVDATNQALSLLSTAVLTAAVDPSLIETSGTGPLYTNGVSRVGYSHVNGFMSADNLVAVSALRGGNVNTSANLNITSNAILTGTTLSVTSNVIATGANISITSANIAAGGGSLNITSNTNISGRVNITGTPASGHAISGNVLFDTDVLIVDSVNNRVGILKVPTTALDVNGAITTVNLSVTTTLTSTGNTLITTGNLLVTTPISNLSSNVVNLNGNSVVVSANVNVTGETAFTANVAIDTNVLFVDTVTNSVGIRTNTPNAPLQVVGDANVSGTLTIANIVATANVNSNNSIATNVLANTVVANVISTPIANVGNIVNIFTTSNTDIGSNTTSPQAVFTYDPTVYVSGKLNTVVRNGTNYQTQEILVVSDVSNSAITVYGTINIGVSANLGSYSVQSNSTSVVISFTQTIANSSFKAVASMLKV